MQLSLVTKKKDLYDKFNRKGHLHYEGGYYIFKPNDLRNTSLSYRDLSTPLTIKTRKLNITKIKPLFKSEILSVSYLLWYLILKYTNINEDTRVIEFAKINEGLSFKSP